MIDEGRAGPSTPTPSIGDGHPHTPGSPPSLFRDRAVLHYAQASHKDGDCLRLSPHWARSVYAFLLIACGVLFAYAVLGRVPEYATGTAVVRLAHVTDIEAPTTGIVEDVAIRNGTRVSRGQVLVRLAAAEEQSVVDNLEAEYRQQAFASVQANDAAGAAATLNEVLGALEPARVRLERKIIRASSDGVVCNLRVRRGRAVAVGDLVLSISPSDTVYELVGLFPGRYAPLLNAGQDLRFHVTGYPHAWCSVAITEVAAEVLASEAIGAILGRSLAGLTPVGQPLVLVRAPLRGHSFTSDNGVHPLVSGLQGSAEVRISNDRIIYAVLPWLKDAAPSVGGPRQ